MIQEEEKKERPPPVVRSTTYYNKIVIWPYESTFKAANSPIIELSAACEDDRNYKDDEEVVFPDPPSNLIEGYENQLK